MVVTPGPEHLYSMREVLFEEVNAHEPAKFVEQLAEHFELVEQPLIETRLLLNQAQLKNLVAMTPYAYKAKPERRQRLEALENFETQGSFQIYLFKKKD